MTEQQIKLILDNPNLSGAVLAKLIGVSRWTVNEFRSGVTWTHNGVGVPFVGFNKASGQYTIRCKRRQIFKGTFQDCMENIDRLIYCLDHNGGKLLPSFKERIFNGLKLIKE